MARAVYRWLLAHPLVLGLTASFSVTIVVLMTAFVAVFAMHLSGGSLEPTSNLEPSLVVFAVCLFCGFGLALWLTLTAQRWSNRGERQVGLVGSAYGRLFLVGSIAGAPIALIALLVAGSVILG